MLRVGVDCGILQLLGDLLPYGIITVNVVGSLAIGLLAHSTRLHSRFDNDHPYRHFALSGLCGGFTTFSMFSLHFMLLIQQGRWTHAALFTLFNILLSLFAVWIGASMTAHRPKY